MLNKYMIYGLGIPFMITAVSPEIAEAYLIESLSPQPDVNRLWTMKVGEVSHA